MNEQLTLKTCLGSENSDKINQFYRKNGSKAEARPTDLFFLILKDDHQILGCVRYCVEENTAMLRTMMIDEAYRKSGLGSRLLQAFEEHLNRHHIKQTFCIPYAHLEKFYSQIGFRNLGDAEMPDFLLERLTYYRKTFPDNKYLCMGRIV